MNEKELFEDFCFLPSWSECNPLPKVEGENYTPQKKELSTLLAELEEIKNNIEDIKAREWHLAKLMKFHTQGFSFR